MAAVHDADHRDTNEGSDGSGLAYSTKRPTRYANTSPAATSAKNQMISTVDEVTASLGELRPFGSNPQPSLLLARVDGLLCSCVSFFSPFFAYFS